MVLLGCTDCQKRDCQHLCDCKKVDSFYGAVATVIKLMLLSLIVNQSFLILFWSHFLAINLFCGGWIVKDSQKFGIHKILISIPLLITYFIGPVGLTLYWFIRIFYAKRINLYD